jgi:multicomponent Na+:H+ antiporter subunit G
MNTVDIVASVALILGALMSLLAGIAVLRFPDTMSRIHAATKPQVLGIMLLMLGVGLRLGSPAVIGMLVLIVILQFVTAPVSAHLTVRVAFRNAQDDERRSAESSARPAADDGPAQLAHALADENDERTASGPGDPAKIADTGAVGKKSGREQRPQR